LSREEYRHLKCQADAWWKQFGLADGLVRRFDASALAGAPTAVARMVLWQAMSDAAGGRALGFADVEHALELAREGGAPFDAPGQRVERRGSQVVLTGRPVGSMGRPAKPGRPMNLFQYSLSIPGEVRVAEMGWILTAHQEASIEAGEWSGAASGLA